MPSSWPASMVIEAENERERRNDPTAHAEIIVAPRGGAGALVRWRLVGRDALRVQEPCDDVRRRYGSGAGPATRLRLPPIPRAALPGLVVDLFRLGSRGTTVPSVTAGVLGARRLAAQLRAFFARKRRSPTTASPGMDGGTVI